jgi:WD40 repeat protein
VNTYKGHSQDISCIDLSPDSKIIASGSLDGTIRFWDTNMHKLVKQVKVGQHGNAVCMAFNPSDLCIAVGTSSKQIKYWELQEFTMVSSSTIQDYVPRGICFPTGLEDGVCFVGFDDCTRVLKLDEDNRKPKLLDVINKPYK